MCTIGVVFEGGAIHTFKQCDLIPATKFNDPEKREGGNGDVEYYIALTRGGNGGRIWSGTNSAGVSFVAADAYTTSANYYVTDEQTAALFNAYEESIRSHATAIEAADYLCKFYEDMGNGTPFPAPDISLITGWERTDKKQPIAIFIEYMPGPNNHAPVRRIERSSGYFCSTNNFRIQPEAVSYAANHSTYLRLARAEAILQNYPSFNGIKEVLTDQYYGKNELSICRETQYVGQEFYTQATALFTVQRDCRPDCMYQINSNPIKNPLRRFGSAS